MKRILTSPIAVTLIVVLMVPLTTMAQSNTSRSNVSVYDYQSSTYRSFDITTRRTGTSRNVTVFDYQNAQFQTYDVKVSGSGNSKNVSVFNYQDPGYSNYNITTRGNDRRKSVTTYDWQTSDYKTYNITGAEDDDELDTYVPLYQSLTTKKKDKSASDYGLPSYDWNSRSTTNSFDLNSYGTDTKKKDKPNYLNWGNDDDDDSDDPW